MSADLRHRLGDRRVVLLTATDGEAAPLLVSFASAGRAEVATKTIRWGEFPAGVAEPARCALIVTGCDKANTAHALTLVLEALDPPPALVLQVGVAGAYGSSGLQVGDLAVASEEVYGDTGVLAPDGWLNMESLGLPLARRGDAEYWNRFPLDPGLVHGALRRLGAAGWKGARPAIVSGVAVTVSQVTGLAALGEELARRFSAISESMEGAAAAHICTLYGVPFLEIRGISNLVMDRDRGSWRLERAAEVAARAAAALCADLDALLSERSSTPCAAAGE